MSWLLYLPTRELADALQTQHTENTNVVIDVSGNWDAPACLRTSAPLQPVALHGEEPAYG